MIRALSGKTAEWLLRAGAIPAQAKELYEYGIYCVLFSLAPVALVLLVSSFLHMVLEGILLILPFILIRKFCGGFHFHSPGLCLITSTALLAGFLLWIRAILRSGQYGWFTAALLVSFAMVVKFSPIDSEGRRLTQAEKKMFKKIAAILAGATLAICGLLACLSYPQIAVPLGAEYLCQAICLSRCPPIPHPIPSPRNRVHPDRQRQQAL